MTTVYVTHDQTEAMSMADQVVLMRDGAIEQQGPPPRSTTFRKRSSRPASSAPRR